MLLRKVKSNFNKISLKGNFIDNKIRLSYFLNTDFYLIS